MTDESSPFFVGGGFHVIKAMTHAVSRIEDHFRNGGGILWGDHDPDLFVGVERFFRPGYAAYLVASWIPALTGIEAKLKAGGKVADVGCGHGSSTIIMAQAYPNSRFWGFDNHAKSIETATERAKDAGVSDRVTFAVSNASEVPDQQYDMVAFFDCLHDMGDPLSACKRAAEVLTADGSALIVEPMAGNTVEENFNIIGRVFSGASTLCCTSNSLALNGPALGAVAPEAAIRDVVIAGGFKEFRRATETPFNRIFEARN
jgi:2-polyprenyl-3-methyl-5-hydroxy-6-metoxy-1,4-benzoquinol methylase